jgi:hypothetical protein
MVGIVVTWRTNQRRQQKHHAAAAKQRTISPSFSLYKMVVLPAASSPTIKIRISFLENRLLNKLWKDPILRSRGVQGAISLSQRQTMLAVFFNHSCMSWRMCCAAAKLVAACIECEWGIH